MANISIFIVARVFSKLATCITLAALNGSGRWPTYVESIRKEIFSVKRNTHIVISTQLATCFGSSEPSSGQHLIYRHGAVSEFPYCLQTSFLQIASLKSIDRMYIYNICKKSYQCIGAS